MKLNGPVISIGIVVALTIVDAAYRVSTAPERIRMRLDTAKATCLNAGNEWVKVGREESCRPLTEQKKI